MRRTETPKPISIKFCMVVDIPDIVSYTNFGDHRLRGSSVAGGQISPSPIDFHLAPCERVIIRKKIIMSNLLCVDLLAALVRTWIHTHQRFLLRLPRCKVFQLLCPNFEWWPTDQRQLSRRRLRFRFQLQLWDSVRNSRLPSTACMIHACLVLCWVYFF